MKYDKGDTKSGLLKKPSPAAKAPAANTTPQIGDYVTEECLGELLSFDELTEMEGQLIVCDCSTESRNWYKVVQVGKIVEQKPDGRRLLYRDNPKKKGLDFACSIGEWVFKMEGTHILGGKEVPRAQRMWRLRGSSEDKHKPTYKDVLLEHYPNFDKSRFDDFAQNFCFAEFFDDDNPRCEYGCTNCLENCWEKECGYEWKLTDEGKKDIEPYLIKSQPPMPANTEETTALFDYSELDSGTAQSLRECETVIRQKTAGYFTLLGEKFKEAQALLADHASGTFEKWYTALGFKRQTVYNLIQRYDFLSSPALEGHENTFEALPLTLSYKISKPDAPKELVEKVIDGGITSNAEYIKLKKELERSREECHRIDANSAAKDKEYKKRLDEANKRADTAEMQSRTYRKNYLQMEKNLGEMSNENTKLEKRIKELESRPVDVAVEQDESALAEKNEEIDRLKKEISSLRRYERKSIIITATIDQVAEIMQLIEENFGKASELYQAISTARPFRIE